MAIHLHFYPVGKAGFEPAASASRTKTGRLRILLRLCAMMRSTCANAYPWHPSLAPRYRTLCAVMCTQCARFGIAGA